MKFTKTLLISDVEQLRQNPPQRGQWVKFAWCDKPSRFHSQNPHSITAFHYPRAVSSFNSFCAASK